MKSNVIFNEIDFLIDWVLLQAGLNSSYVLRGMELQENEKG